MREIKFKAWDKEKKHMVDNVVFLDFKAKQIGCHRTGYGSYCQPFENVELLQYTGLKDSKRTKEYPEGQEIYEGDIGECVYDGNMNVYVVVYDLEELNFKATNGKENGHEELDVVLA